MNWWFGPLSTTPPLEGLVGYGQIRLWDLSGHCRNCAILPPRPANTAEAGTLWTFPQQEALMPLQDQLSPLVEYRTTEADHTGRAIRR